MENNIIRARDAFLQDKKNTLIAYDLRHDLAGYKELTKLPFISHEKRARIKNSLDNYTKEQLVTHLGERLQVLLRKTKYEIKDRQIYGKDTVEPFINMLKRGRDYCRIHSEPVDHAREDAEVTSFEEIQKELCDPSTAPGTMMLLISPCGERGSRYQHNFYDVFVLRESRKGEKYIMAHRYSSGLNKKETLKKASELDARFLLQKDIPDSASFLSMPTKIDNNRFQTPEDIHKFLHKEHEYISSNNYEIIKKECESFINLYLQALHDEPVNVRLHAKIFRAFLNKSEEVLESLKAEKIAIPVFKPKMQQLDWKEVDRLSALPVKFRVTGCGGTSGTTSSSLSLINNNSTEDPSSPFSVSTFGRSESSGWHNGTCAKCGSHTRVGGCNICQPCVDTYFS